MAGNLLKVKLLPFQLVTDPQIPETNKESSVGLLNREPFEAAKWKVRHPWMGSANDGADTVSWD